MTQDSLMMFVLGSLVGFVLALAVIALGLMVRLSVRTNKSPGLILMHKVDPKNQAIIPRKKGKYANGEVSYIDR